MNKLVLDIETIGDDFDSYDDVTKEHLLSKVSSDLDDDQKIEEVKKSLGLSPLTGQIVALGVLDIEKDKGAVYFQAPDSDIAEFEENGIKYVPGTEKEILEKFWEVAKSYNEFITFNGRGFDAPYMVVRSAINGIKPSKDLMKNRYTNYQSSDAIHTDLMDQLSFYGAVWKKGSLHMWCKAFGIKSPKEGEVAGDGVGQAFADKRYEEIARYNVDDLKATKSLYEYWVKYIRS